jgi:protein-tyrosine phosphatase
VRPVPPYALYLGSAVDSWNLKELLAAGIEAVIDLAENEPPMPITRELIYLRIPLVDGGGNAPRKVRLAVNSLLELLRGGVPTFVFCSAGMSRSPAIAAAAMAKHSKRPVEECLADLCREHPADVSPAFFMDLTRFVAED